MPVIEAPPIEYYYDTHITEEDVPESHPHTELLGYLCDVFEWLFWDENWLITSSLYIFQTDNPQEKPVAPDVAVYIGVDASLVDTAHLTSWVVEPPLRPAPRVVFEIASGRTAPRDIDEKPSIYANMGVAEYFSYDPRPDRPAEKEILQGWRFPERGQQQEMECDERGWMWSAELQSWLVPDGTYLRICDRQGRHRLTEKEARRLAEEAERTAKEAERTAKEAERRAKEEALAAREAERAAKEAERAAKEKALEELNRARARLIALGIDPDTV